MSQSVLKLVTMNGKKIIARNRKAKFEYELFEFFEAGIELRGTEIKSISAGQVSLSEAMIAIVRLFFIQSLIYYGGFKLLVQQHY